VEDLRAQFVQILQQQAGLDAATADNVANVAIRFAQEHAPELIAQYAPEPFKSMAAQVGGSSGGVGGLLTGLTGGDR
jgi:hypothetical protein